MNEVKIIKDALSNILNRNNDNVEIPIMNRNSYNEKIIKFTVLNTTNYSWYCKH